MTRRALSVLGLLAAGVAGAACSTHEPAHDKPPPALPAAEIQRGEDACAAYVAKVCACTAPPAQQQCPLAKSLPEAMHLALDTAANPTTEKADAARALASVRETIKECIEETAKLPLLGCH